MGETPKIGAFVLESLTSGMYTDPLDALREYVQNSCDSVRSAEEYGIIGPGRGWVRFATEPTKRTLSITDNGTGVAAKDIVGCLLDIGMSRKSIETNAGFRGIGRLAGIAYCDSLIFRTSAFGEMVVTTVQIDCAAIRHSISPSSREFCELSDVIEKHSHVSEEPCGAEDHYFEVTLESVSETASCYLEWHILEVYLSQVAPVGFDSQRFPFAQKIAEWTHVHSLHVPTLKLFIKTPEIEREVLKPYGTRYTTRVGGYGLEVRNIAFYPEEPDTSTRFWAWYTENDLLGMIGDRRSAGLRFRKHNIAFGGPERVSDLFSGGEGRLNHWLLGEIHVCSSAVIPNARRDGFEPNAAWEHLRSELAVFIAIQCRACHLASSATNRPAAKVIAGVQETLRQARTVLESGFASTEDHIALLSRIEKDCESSKRLLDSRSSQNDAKRILPLVAELQIAQDSMRSIQCYKVKDSGALRNREQQRVVFDVLRVIHDQLGSESCGKHRDCISSIKSAILENFQIEESGHMF